MRSEDRIGQHRVVDIDEKRTISCRDKISDEFFARVLRVPLPFRFGNKVLRQFIEMTKLRQPGVLERERLGFALPLSRQDDSIRSVDLDQRPFGIGLFADAGDGREPARARVAQDEPATQMRKRIV